MTNMRIAAIASLGVVLSGQPVSGQTPFSYREHALGSSVASVVKITGARASDTKTLHERPARIQQVEWRAPYVLSGETMADPVRDVVFSFYDDQLFQIVVTYDRDRMEGLTNDDVIESLSATYGVPLLVHRRAPRMPLPADLPAEATVVARWEDAASLVTLTRGSYSLQYQLVLISKTLNARAKAAITEALRLDTVEAPQRELDHRNRALADARAATVKARIVNKAAFKP
jgi:hypothetical protein